MASISLLAAALIATGPLPNHAEMVKVADAFDQAQLAKDKTALEAMADEELIFIDGSGKRQGKREFVAGWTGSDETYDPIVLIDRTVTPLGADSFVVSAETVLAGTSSGQRFSSRFRFSDTFRRVGKQWRAIHIQVTRIAK